MTTRRKLELSIYQIFSELVKKTIETIWMKKKDFQQTYRIVGTKTHDITLIVKKVETPKITLKEAYKIERERTPPLMVYDEISEPK